MKPIVHRTKLVVVLMAVLVGCDSSTGPEGSATGVYSLISINGTNLPFLVEQVGNDRLELVQGSLSINADGTCSVSFTFRETQAGSVTTAVESDICTWAQNNTAVQFNWSDGSSDSGSLQGRSLSITSEGLVFLFRR